MAKYVGQSTKEVAAKESKGKIILKVHDSDSWGRQRRSCLASGKKIQRLPNFHWIL